MREKCSGWNDDDVEMVCCLVDGLIEVWLLLMIHFKQGLTCAFLFFVWHYSLKTELFGLRNKLIMDDFVFTSR